MKTVLMVAFHYPPAAHSSGLQRTLKFSQYLLEFGWQPIVLTAHPRAYALSRNDQLQDVPANVVVRRAFALDASRHLKAFGRYPRCAALPDRWASWWFGGAMSGRRLLAKFRPHLIWSTYPIATAHLIAGNLQGMSGLPWVADFRDPMIEGDYPPDKKQRLAYQRIEARTMERSSCAVYTTEGALRLYQSRYPNLPKGNYRVVPNGFDEENFADAERMESRRSDRDVVAPLTLLHSGVVYPSERDPRSFFAAVDSLSRNGQIGPASLRIVLRAPGFVEHYKRRIDELGIGNIVTLEPAIPYRAALREMLDADGLLVLQASNCNNQVPAKLYEYLRAKRPILALTDPAGDTAAVLRDAGVRAVAPLGNAEEIARSLMAFLDDIRQGKAHTPSADQVALHSRRARTKSLAAIFDELHVSRSDRRFT